MTKIGIISDTHIPEAGRTIPNQALKALRGVDVILHAGDMHIIEVLDWLEEIAPVYGARGNGDVYQSDWRPGVPDDPRVKDAHVLDLDGWIIGLTHGFPTPDLTPWLTLDSAMDRFFGRKVDIIVCGDTHVPRIRNHDGVIEVNPGSPTLPRNIAGLGTLATLDLSSEFVTAEIIHL